MGKVLTIFFAFSFKECYDLQPFIVSEALSQSLDELLANVFLTISVCPLSMSLHDLMERVVLVPEFILTKIFNFFSTA